MRHHKSAGRPVELVIGTFRFEPDLQRLCNRNGDIVRLRRQSLHVLTVLARSPGEIVSKSRLMDEVWDRIATTEDSLVQCIADIRRTLGREVVETFPKRGYRLRTGTEGQEKAVRPSRWVAAAAFMSIAVLLAVAIRFHGIGDPGVAPPGIAAAPTLAGLPSSRYSEDPALRVFGQALLNDLTTDLSSLGNLSFAVHLDRAAGAGARGRGGNRPARYVLHGTVRQHGDRIRINVALVDSEAGANIWAERYDVTGDTPAASQDSVTARIVHALALGLGAQCCRPQLEPDAYYMLLSGLKPLRSHTAPGNLKARAQFQRALELDPGYARAHANLALTYARETVFRYSERHSPALVERGLEAAITAIQLDSTIPDAYLALGVLNLAIGRHDNALSAARHSIRLDETFSDGYALLAEVAAHGGDLEEGLAAIQHAKRLHPRYPFIYDWIEGHILFMSERYMDALPLLQEVARRNPRFYRGLVMLSATYGQIGNLPAARETLNKAGQVRPGTVFASEAARLPYAANDRRERLSAGLRLAGSSL